jgi:hypothetical protein
MDLALGAKRFLDDVLDDRPGNTEGRAAPRAGLVSVLL